LVLKLGGNVCLKGFWQSWRYFADIQDLIHQEFTLKSPLGVGATELAKKIQGVTAVGIHIRRGDYVSNPVTHQFHGICDLDYYARAISCMAEAVQQPYFFVFSDEPQWARENLKIDFPCTIIDPNHQDYEDLYLLSLCQHFIIANSSFSWWAAWLSSNPGKSVIAPRRWFAAEDIDMGDLALPGWQLI
jgi:hypothetical protein